MTWKKADTGPEKHRSRLPWSLFLAGVLLTAIYASVAALSRRFAPGTDAARRPILTVLLLLGVAFGIHLAATAVAVRTPSRKRVVLPIVVFSLLMRAVTLPSWPILEVDIYRYVLDGGVGLVGIDSFRYSPADMLALSNSSSPLPVAQKLKQLFEQRPAMRVVLSRVHFPELTTIYPVVSQMVFRLAVRLTPENATVFIYLLVMKVAIVCFDMATVFIVIRLLQLAGIPVGWSILYAWSPLVIKEFANTGHLDSIAVFFSTVTVLGAMAALRARTRGTQYGGIGVSAGGLVCAVGAKLYPLVLLPVMTLMWRRAAGWRVACLALLGCAVLCFMLIWPMVEPLHGSQAVSGAAPGGGYGTAAAPEQIRDNPETKSGLLAFVRRWEMNDFLFMLVLENLRPASAGGDHPWFAVTPDRFRRDLVEVGERFVPAAKVPFFLARLVTLLFYIAIAGLVLRQTAAESEGARWGQAVFLVIAWFWLLSPVQNPWYWTWALPFVMFARCRSWLAPGGFLFLYYLRFWFGYHFPVEHVAGTSYAGAAFFDYVVVWLEYCPWLVALALEGCCKRSR